MSIVDDILQKFDLKYEDLHPAERETLMGWLDQLDNNQLTLEQVRGFVHSLKESVEGELTQVGHNSKEDIFLKARLRNLMLLEAFMTSPEKARTAIERAIAGIVNNRSAKGVK